MPKIGKRIVKNPSEHKCYQHLQTIVPEGFKVEYETETLPYVIEHEYRPDYPITKGDGSKLYIEYKGNGRAFDNAVRQKMIAVKKKYPDVDFCIVFHSDGKIGPKRKDGSFMKQSDWATKNGFKFCIGMQNIPQDWFK